MSNLAGTYIMLGRPQDALALLERVLELYQRALPEDHPNIGAVHASGFIVFGFDACFEYSGDAMYNLAAGYDQCVGRQQDAMMMSEKALEFRRRVLPADHSDIGDGHECSFSC